MSHKTTHTIENDAEDAAEARGSVVAVRVISSASAEDEDQDYDEEESCSFFSLPGR